VLRVSLARVGASGRSFLRILGGSSLLLVDAFYWGVVAPLRGRGRPRRELIYAQMVSVGVRSIPIIVLVNFFVGMILAISMASLLQQLGMVSKVANVVGVAVTRELAPLMTAIISSGFVGAAMAAELGTMTVSEEVLALEASAVNPIRFLVVPRLMAVIVMLPALTVLANYSGLFGGYIVGVKLLGIGPDRYLKLTQQVINPVDIGRGLIKAVAFGTIITLVACYQGLSVKGGAEGVGRATTRSVVISIVAIIIANLFFTTLFYYTMKVPI